ncbi:site-specific integrase [bacterium]|nr:MAG: site-specific integrase [bacterium]
MKKESVSAKIVHYVKVKNNSDIKPVKLRITFNREHKFYSLINEDGTGRIACDKDDFKTIMSTKPGKFKDLKLYLNSIELKATEIIKSIEDFSFDKFDKQFTAKRTDKGNVFAIFQNAIDKLNEEGRAGTASSYKNSLASLKAYTKKDSIRFEDITVDFLKAYEKWNISEGNSLTTVGIYLRNVRTLFNDAVAAGEIKREIYPFGKRGYQIPSGRGRKLALPINELGKIFNYKSEGGATEEISKDLWIFSYLCNGANIKDIARLKYKNIQEDTIVFIRAKTERTSKKDQKDITAVFTDEAKAIIERWGNKPPLADTYVFPILTPGISAQREQAIIKQRTKTINKYIKRIAEASGIKKNITTYTARHSFSTVLKRSGASIEFISESLGHQDTKTTKSYLDSFEQSVKKEWAAKLTDFGKDD